jgi:DNA-binding XRE family transcriptional regulator
VHTRDCAGPVSSACPVTVTALPQAWSAAASEAFAAAVSAMLEDARGWRLAEMRKRRGLTQEQVAERMGVSVARISQIEGGDVSTQDVLNRFVAAPGGTLKLIADFGDEQLKIA